MSMFFVDCEGPYGEGSPAVADMTCFGAVEYETRQTFYGKDCSQEVMQAFADWIAKVNSKGRPVFVSDNPAYDWQWINFYFWRYFDDNPFGHSARRIGDFYAGLVGDWGRSSEWKSLRRTKHDHHPVNDAMGNVEAFEAMLRGERGKPMNERRKRFLNGKHS